DAPRVEVRIEVERAEGDPDFRRPAVGAHRGARLPDAVPRLVRATAPTAAAEDPVAHEPGGVDLEEVPGAPVPERVEDPHEPVVGAQPGIALSLIGEDALGVVVDDRADVERVRVE